MFAFADVLHFFAHKLARLRGRRLAFALIFARAFNYFFFWHNKRTTPLATPLDVINNVRDSRAESTGRKHTTSSAGSGDQRITYTYHHSNNHVYVEGNRDPNSYSASKPNTNTYAYFDPRPTPTLRTAPTPRPRPGLAPRP